MALRLSGLLAGAVIGRTSGYVAIRQSAYLNDKRVAVQALSGSLKEHRNFVEHRRIGLVTHHFCYIFQLVDLRNHLLQTLVVVHQ